MALLGTNEFLQMSPIFIAVFMLMTSMFNGDVKAYIWLGCAILGVVSLIPLSRLFIFKSPDCITTAPVVIDIFSKYPGLSVSTFFIVFTLTYLIWPMMQNKDWNYYVIVGFLGMLVADTLVKVRDHCITKEGIFAGAVLGAGFSYLCNLIILTAGGDKLLYYNTVSSNNIYCSRPKKQQFKCYVYKNGEIISTL
jgi:hypothetical protein